MTSLAVDNRNSIYLGPDGNLVLVTDREAVLQDARHKMGAQLGEMVLNLLNGLPTDQTVWANYNAKQFELFARQNLKQVPNVNAVVSFNVIKEANSARWEALLDTPFGLIPVAGVIRG